MNCAWVKDNLCDIMDGLLPSEVDEQYQLHLAECTECRTLITELSLDQQTISSLPRVLPPVELMAGVMATIRRPEKKAFWPFFAPRFAPVAAALAIMVLGLNFWTAYFPYPSLTPGSALMETQMAPRLFAVGGEEPDASDPAISDNFRQKSIDTASLEDIREDALPARPTILKVSSVLGGSIFLVWGVIVIIWYKRS